MKVGWPTFRCMICSPKKVASQKCKTSRKRRNLSLQHEPAMKQPNTSTKATHEDTSNNTITSEVYCTPVGEALLTDLCLHELPTETVSSCDYDDDDDTFVVDGSCSSASGTTPAEKHKVWSMLLCMY